MIHGIIPPVSSEESFPDWRLAILNRYSPLPELTKANDTWNDSWQKNSDSTGETPRTKHNDFTETDAATALFYGETCAALALHKLVNLHEDLWRAPNHFTHWTEEALAILTKNGAKVLVSSHYTVHRDFRKGGSGKFAFNLKEFLVGVSFRYFLSTPAQAMTGDVRNDKELQNFFCKWGALPIITSVATSTGKPNDPLGVFRDSLNLDADPFVAAFVGKVWSDRENAARPRQIAPLELGVIFRDFQ